MSWPHSRPSSAPNPYNHVRSIEPWRTLATRERTRRGAVPVVSVTAATRSDPGCEFASNGTIVESLTLIPKFSSDSLPSRAVTGARPSECVRHLVEEHLMYLVILVFGGEMP